jgi:hypothetical protein
VGVKRAACRASARPGTGADRAHRELAATGETTRTVKYHPCKVFTKLGITARGQLQRVFPPS